MRVRCAPASRSNLSRSMVAAAIATALTLAGAPQDAQAADDAPLTSAPLLYDSANKLVGPYYAGTAYIQFREKTYEVNMYPNGINEGQFSIFYAIPNCEGRAFLPKTIIPNMYSFRDHIYYPAKETQLVKWQSKKTFYAGSEPRCEYPSINQPAIEMSKVIKKAESELEIAFPVRAKP